jgi:hypothetical protein
LYVGVAQVDDVIGVEAKLQFGMTMVQFTTDDGDEIVTSAFPPV